MSGTLLLMIGGAIGIAMFLVARLGQRFQPERDTLIEDGRVWAWFNDDGSLKKGPDVAEEGERVVADERLKGHQIPSPSGMGKPWPSLGEARFRPSNGLWHLLYQDPVSGERVLKHVPDIQMLAEDVWREYWLEHASEKQDGLTND